MNVICLKIIIILTKYLQQYKKASQMKAHGLWSPLEVTRSSTRCREICLLKKKTQQVGQAFMHSERRHTNVNTDNWRKKCLRFTAMFHW